MRPPGRSIHKKQGMEHPFERILLVTEHTEFDGDAERLAFDIARQCGIGLRAVFPVVRNLEYEIGSPDLAQRSALELAEKVRQLKSAANDAGITFDLVVRQCEQPHAAIVQEATDCRADLIIARRRGRRSFLSHLMIGEMVSKVAANAPCNMLFVPSDARLWSHAILAAVDVAAEAEPIAEMASKVAAACKLPLTLLNVSENNAQGAQAHARGILAMAETKLADLIILGHQSEITKKVIERTDVSVLVVKGNQYL